MLNHHPRMRSEDRRLERGSWTRVLPTRSLTISEILRLADAYHDRYGKWPKEFGRIAKTSDNSWQKIGIALRLGKFGLPGGTTLARLLSRERGTSFGRARKPLTAEGILAWADAHHARMGKWPTYRCGEIPEAPGEKWTKVHLALQRGHRGIAGGSTLRRFLAMNGRTRRRVAPRCIATESQPVETGPSRTPD